MREFESIHVLRTDVARTGWLENRSRKVPAQNTELPRSPVWGSAAVAWSCTNLSEGRC